MTRRARRDEQGGITIVVSLMLLTLLTVTVIGLSRNAMRETLILSAVKQSQDIREVADTGIEWTIAWMNPKVWTQANVDANPLLFQIDRIIKDPELVGQVMDVATSSGAKMALARRTNEPSGLVRDFSLQVAAMGRLPITDLSVQDKRLWPLLFMTRSQGRVEIPGGMKFQHNREAWISTPIPEVR